MSLEAYFTKRGEIRPLLQRKLVPCNGLRGDVYNNERDSYFEPVYAGTGTENTLARGDHYHFGASTLVELAALLEAYWRANGMAVRIKLENIQTGLWQEVKLDGATDESAQIVLGPGESI